MAQVTRGRKEGAGEGWRSFLHGAIAVVSLGVMMFAIPNAAAAFKYLKTGMEVPDFTLKTIEGKEVSLAEFKGAPATVILFWSTWSPRSRPALEDAQKLFAEYGGQGFKVLTVNVNGLQIGHQDRQQIKEMQGELGITLPVAIDDGLGTYNAFGVVATPSTAVLDPEGKIVFEAASYLRFTGESIREQVEILLGVREPAGEAVAEEPAYKPARKALLYYNLGRNLLRLGNREKAMRKLEDSVEADDKFAAPRILLGHLLLGERSPEALARAEELFRGAVESEADNVSALSGLGEALLDQGKVEEAAGQFARAIEIDPAYTPAVANMALVLARQGKEEDSRERFKEALELNPLDPGTYFLRGESLEGTGNLGGAAADYRRAIEIMMDLPPTGDEV
jgi:Tfp pilus assembly protein PilF/peroxiredoxin